MGRHSQRAKSGVSCPRKVLSFVELLFAMLLCFSPQLEQVFTSGT